MTVQRFTLAEIKANLVIMSDIAFRADVAVTTVHSWTTRYADWPEPLLGGASQRPGQPGRQAAYWWPQVQEFMETNNLPRDPAGREAGARRLHRTTRQIRSPARAGGDPSQTRANLANFT